MRFWQRCRADYLLSSNGATCWSKQAYDCSLNSSSAWSAAWSRPREGFCVRAMTCGRSVPASSTGASMEFEANQFAAMLLMLPPILRAELACKNPSLDEVIRLARDFAVSKEAMARSYAEYSRSDIAIVRTRNGKILNAIRSRDFPRIEPSPGDAVPTDSVWHNSRQVPGVPSPISPCEPDTWFAYSDSRLIEALTEQVLHQAGGYAMIFLHAEMRDEDDHDGERSFDWSRR
jgi:IrrE N-terminal-like domain